MAELLQDHDHCLGCDDPIEKGQQYCSDLCRDKMMAEQRKERNKNYLFIAVVLDIALALVVIFYR